MFMRGGSAPQHSRCDLGGALDRRVAPRRCLVHRERAVRCPEPQLERHGAPAGTQTQRVAVEVEEPDGLQQLSGAFDQCGPDVRGGHVIRHDESDPWGNYVRGMAVELMKDGVLLRGMEGVVEGNVPVQSVSARAVATTRSAA